MTELTPTQEKIHGVAKEHFLKYGFEKASLRKIVSEAGFTLGAFYGYYDSKEELFDALVGDVAKGIIQMVSAMGDEADSIPDGKRMSDMTNVFSKALPGLADYLLDNRDEVRLLLKCSDGTKYENFLDGLMQRDLDSMKEIAGDSFPLNPLSSALLVNSYFKALGDAAISGRPRDEIIQAMQDIQDMFAGGMIYLMKGRN